MGKAFTVGRPRDAQAHAQLAELQRAVNAVTIRPAGDDIHQDGAPKHDTACEQMEGRYVRFTSRGPGVEVSVNHGLGRIPVGFIEVGRTYPASVTGWPNRPSVNKSWSKERVSFRSQAPAGVEYVILLL